MAIQHLVEPADLDADVLPDLITLLRPLPARQPDRGPLQLHLLGSPQLALAGRPLVPRTRKTLALLAYLALQGGRHPREHLADLFWPEADLEDGRASLRTTLSYVRQALGSDADTYLATSREFVGLHPDAPLDLDVHDLAEAQQALHRASEGCMVRRRIEAAVERYRGSLLADLSLPDAPDFEAWMEGQRTHWRGVVAELLARLVDLQIHDGDAGAALTTLARWTEVDPDDDIAWQQLLELRLRSEDRAGARRTWQKYRAVLAELDVEPSRSMVALAARLADAPFSLHAVPGTSPAEPDLVDVPALSVGDWSREWAALHAAFERSHLGRPQIVILAGAVELDKTRLISRFSEHAREAGADLLVGRALHTIGELPYAAVVDALRTRLDNENAPDDLLADVWLGELARLLPELRERYPDLPVLVDDPALARGRLFEAVARLGQALAARRPLVFFLDDAQWTDPATRDLLRYTLRRWTDAGTPLLLILAVRGEDPAMDSALTHWLGELEHEAPAIRVERSDRQGSAGACLGDATGLHRVPLAINYR